MIDHLRTLLAHLISPLSPLAPVPSAGRLEAARCRSRRPAREAAADLRRLKRVIVIDGSTKGGVPCPNGLEN